MTRLRFCLGNKSNDSTLITFGLGSQDGERNSPPIIRPIIGARVSIYEAKQLQSVTQVGT